MLLLHALLWFWLVALLAEGVDRNNQVPRLDITRSRSPSSRRAWIEIRRALKSTALLSVALLAEGVDRNLAHTLDSTSASKSPSSRRAWIEI